jgi:hypothetical protein
VHDTTTTPNVPALRAVIAHIEQHPGQWNQGTFRRCFAARAALLAGGEWINPEPDGTNWDLRMVPLPGEDHSVWNGIPSVFVGSRAQRVCGLGAEQAYDLFDQANILDDLRRVVDRICATAEAARAAE